MSKSLYDTLGVPASATHEELKQAYRRLAKEHHPDKGGDHAKFVEIQKAYETLSDPEKRAHYDRYGSRPEGPTMCDRAHQIMAGFFAEAINSGQYERYEWNPLETAKSLARNKRHEFQRQIANLRHEAKKNRKLAKSLKAKGSDRMLLDLVVARRRDVWKHYRDTQFNFRLTDMAVEMLNDYEFNQSGVMYNQGSPFATSVWRTI